MRLGATVGAQHPERQGGRGRGGRRSRRSAGPCGPAALAARRDPASPFAPASPRAPGSPFGPASPRGRALPWARHLPSVLPRPWAPHPPWDRAPLRPGGPARPAMPCGPVGPGSPFGPGAPVAPQFATAISREASPALSVATQFCGTYGTFRVKRPRLSEVTGMSSSRVTTTPALPTLPETVRSPASIRASQTVMACCAGAAARPPAGVCAAREPGRTGRHRRTGSTRRGMDASFSLEA